MATGQRVDPYRSFRFLVEIYGIVQAGFSECTGFGSNVEVIEFKGCGHMAPVTQPEPVNQAIARFLERL